MKAACALNTSIETEHNKILDRVFHNLCLHIVKGFFLVCFMSRICLYPYCPVSQIACPKCTRIHNLTNTLLNQGNDAKPKKMIVVFIKVLLFFIVTYHMQVIDNLTVFTASSKEKVLVNFYLSFHIHSALSIIRIKDRK